MKGDKTISGVTPVHGTILRVNELVTSDSVAALKESLSIYDSYYLGGHIRPVRRAVFIDRPTFGMAMMANDVPLLDIALTTAKQSFKPYEDLMAFEELLNSMGGSMHAPAITIQPATTVLANGYKFADTLVESQNAWYDNKANWLANHNHIKDIRIGVPQMLSTPGSMRMSLLTRTVTALPRVSSYTVIPTAIVDGSPTYPVQDPYEYRGVDGASFRTMLLPIEGQGPGVFLGRIHSNDSKRGADGSLTTTAISRLIPLRWGIFYQEQDVEIQSPIKRLAMIAYLNHLFDYFDGVNLEIGQYNWPDNQGKASPAYSPSVPGSTGHHIINDILVEVAKSAALRLEYRTAEELPNSLEMQLIRAIVNLLYFLDHRDLFIKALCNTPDIRQFMVMLLESEVIAEGVPVLFLDPATGAFVAHRNTDVQSGIFPKEAADFFWQKIMPMLPDDVFDNQLLTALTNGARVLGAPTKDQYEKWLAEGLIKQSWEDPQANVRWLAQFAKAGTASVKHMNLDMRSDFLAGAILARVRESLPLVIALLKGEVQGFEHIHSNERILSVEVAMNILETINAMIVHDMLADPAALEWEHPYTGARYSTQWQSYSVRFPTYPIQYVVHDAAQDCLAEIKALDPAHAGKAQLYSMVQQAFKTLGISLIQCEPMMSFVPLHDDSKQGAKRLYMAGERQLNGTRNPSNTEIELYGDVDVANGAIKVTSTYYVRSATIWNQLLEMPHQVTARGNNPQPVPKDWHTYAALQIPVNVVQKLLFKKTSPLAEALATAILNVKSAGALSFPHIIDLNPAFRDIGVVCPYVQMLVQTPPEAYAFFMMSRVSFNSEQRICNIAGSPIVMDRFAPVAGVPADQTWRLPNLSSQMAYTATPVTHMVLSLLWNAVR